MGGRDGTGRDGPGQGCPWLTGRVWPEGREEQVVVEAVAYEGGGVTRVTEV